MTLYTAQEAATILKVRPRTINSWAKQGKMEFVTLPSGEKRFILDRYLGGNDASA